MANVNLIQLKKGDCLLKENDPSTAMYWVQSGSLRLFKKKGTGFVELGVIHSGEIIGELSFLDNQPRSASAEALQNSEIIEIPRGNFDKFMATTPQWMASLIKTLVGRIRSVNNRLRELDSNSTVYVQDDLGRTSKVHEFLSEKDLMRLCSALLLVASRHGEKLSDGGIKIRAGWMQVVAGHIMGMPLAKIQSFTDVLQEVQFIKLEKTADHVDIYLFQEVLLERFMYWLHEESIKPDDKRQQITPEALKICDFINDHGGVNFEQCPESTNLNIIQVFEKATDATGQKQVFNSEAFKDLIKLGFANEIRVASDKEQTFDLFAQKFVKNYPMLVLKERFDGLNATKRGE